MGHCVERTKPLSSLWGEGKQKRKLERLNVPLVHTHLKKEQLQEKI